MDFLKSVYFLFVGGWVDLDVIRYFTLLLFIGLVWGQESKFDSINDNEDLNNGKLLDEKTFSISLGLGGNRLMSLIAITKDIKVKDNFGIFLGGGWSVPFFGIGAYFQPNYNKTGFNGSLAIGPSLSFLNREFSLNLNYQIKISKSSFLSAGLSTGFIESHNIFTGKVNCCDNFTFPTLFYHFRL